MTSLTLALVFLSSTVASDGVEPLKIGIPSFCPFACPVYEQAGYTVDIISRVLDKNKVPYTITYYPWARGVKLATSGAIDILLAPAKDEAPDLVYPNEPIAIQENCFFTKKNSTWTYESFNSIDDKTKIVVFDSWAHEQDFAKIKQIKDSNFHYLSYNERYHTQAAGLVERARATAFWEDPSVLNFYLGDQYRNAGCVSAHFLYSGLSKKAVEKNKDLIPLIDNGIKYLRQSGELKKILDNYNTDDWADKKEVGFH